MRGPAGAAQVFDEFVVSISAVSRIVKAILKLVGAILATMDLTKTIDDFRAERDRLNAAIVSLEQLAAGRGLRRRGHPPAWIAALTRAGAVPKRCGRLPRTK